MRSSYEHLVQRGASSGGYASFYERRSAAAKRPSIP
jgi:hypothetical protein